MKKILLLTLTVMSASILLAQTPRKPAVQDARDKYANTALNHSLPEGTTLKKGKVTVNKGYKASYAEDKRIVIVKKDNGDISGSFKCGCLSDEGGGCSVQIIGQNIYCSSSGCKDCSLLTTIHPTSGVAITQADNWQQVILPTAKPQPKTEDPDQGGEIIRKKNARVKQ